LYKFLQNGVTSFKRAFVEKNYEELLAQNWVLGFKNMLLGSQNA